MVSTLSGSMHNNKSCVMEGSANAAAFIEPFGMGLSPNGETLYVADRFCNAIRSIDTSTGDMATIIGLSGGIPGNGDGAVDLPRDVTVSLDGKSIFWTEFGTNSVRTLDLDTRETTTLIDGLLGPWGIDLSPDGTKLVVADSYRNRIIQIPV